MGHERFRYQDVETHILSIIESGGLQAGDRLPSLRELSLRMRVSIATANQGYLELERKGVIEARPRSGFYLRQPAGQLPPPATPPSPALEPMTSNRSALIQEALGAVGNSRLVSFGVSGPDETLLPGKTLARMMGAAIRESPTFSLGYEAIAGNPELRRQIAFRSQTAGIRCAPEETLITSGAMEALYIAIRSVTRPGDNVLIQSPSYYCFLQLLENCSLRAIEIPSYPDRGVCPDDLGRALSKFDIAACILAPNFNNPDGSLTPDDTKGDVVRLLGERNIPLIEDDVYGDLHFGPQRPGTYKAYDQKGLVIYCSSFSKTLCPGYRVGWMLPGRFFRKALEVKSTTNVSSATPTQIAVAAYLRAGLHERHLRRLRSAISDQMQTMQLHLSRHFPPQTRASRPQGGTVLWLELPQQIDAVDFFYAARQQGIGIVPGPIFSTQDRYDNFIRISCNGIWNEEIRQGVETLGQLAHNWPQGAVGINQP